MRRKKDLTAENFVFLVDVLVVFNPKESAEASEDSLFDFVSGVSPNIYVVEQYFSGLVNARIATQPLNICSLDLTQRYLLVLQSSVY